jgi:ATP-binding cassette subfamily C protein
METQLNRKILNKSLKLLNKSDQRKLYLIILCQIVFGALDLIGVAFVGVLGSLAISGVNAEKPGDRVTQLLEMLQLDNYDYSTQASIIGLMAAGFMISKTMFSMLFTKKSLTFLSYRSAQFSAKLARKILSQQHIEIKDSSKQEILYGLTSGANNLILGILGSFVSIISDLSLILVMLFGLFIIEPKIAIGSLLFYGLVGFILQKNLSYTATKLGEENAKLSIKVNESIVDVLDIFRELFVRDKLNQYVSEIENARIKVAKTNAKMAFLPYISKYVLETAIVVGALILAATQFAYQDTGRAFGNLAIFLAAGTRIVPAILRLQQGLLLIKLSTGGAAPTLAIYDRILTELPDYSIRYSEYFSHEGFIPSISIKNVSFKYKKSSKFEITNINLEIPPGKVVALVGTSGAGKSTLADLILGVIVPDFGEVLISGKPPKDVIKKWPGAVSYVPQDVAIMNTSVFRNISLQPDNKIPENIDQLIDSLKISQLDFFSPDSKKNITDLVGEGGSKLSGGQRQRLGIARALYTNPNLLVMDEATSSLDASTENVINESIQNLKGSSTIIIIAHRLATVRNADIVCYIQDGKIEASGTFEEVRIAVPDFDKQAKLLGL